MTTSQTETEFVNALADSADAVDSQTVYAVYQQWAQRTCPSA